MIAILQLWWPVLVLLHVPLLVNTIAVTVFKRISHAHDWELPDDLPQTAGDWLRDRAVRDGLRVIVTDDEHQADGYSPDHRVIFLGAVTHFKADPVYWAIAAHELGHARLHAEHPLIGALSRISTWMKHVFLLLGATIALGNVLYALPRGLELSFALLGASLALRTLELCEEAYASRLAYRELRASGVLGAPHLRAVRHSLFAALGTYVSTVASGGFLLSQWSIVERITGDGRLGELAELTVLGWILVIVICVLGLVYAGFHVQTVRARKRKAGTTERRQLLEALVILTWKLALLGLLALVWNLHGTSTWAWLVILALIGEQHILRSLLMLPLLYPAMKLARWIARRSGPGHHESDELAAAREAGKPLIDQGRRALLDIAEWRVNHPTPASRVNDVLRLAYLPLIVAIGGGLIT